LEAFQNSTSFNPSIVAQFYNYSSVEELRHINTLVVQRDKEMPVKVVARMTDDDDQGESNSGGHDQLAIAIAS
jgi:hypothetical protein